MTTFNTYQTRSDGTLTMRKWFFRAFVISLFLHFVLFLSFRATPLERFSNEQTERLVPRAFTVSRAEIDPKLLEPEKPETPPKKEVIDAPKINLALDKPSFEKTMNEVHVMPVAPEIAKPILNEKPKIDTKNWQTMTKMQEPSSPAFEKDLISPPEQSIQENPKALRSLNPYTEKNNEAHHLDSETAINSAIPGLSNLDDLLAGGPIGKGTKPIGIPGGALYEYDSAELKPEAIEQLKKLGLLIQRNPRATFSIEGHTDSFGNPEYNQTLSERRAESVKEWLVTNMGIDPVKIQTKGFGSSKLIAPETGTIEEQQNNRRTEIVIKTPQ